MKEYKRVYVHDDNFELIINKLAQENWTVLNIFEGREVSESRGGGLRNKLHDTYFCFLQKDIEETK